MLSKSTKAGLLASLFSILPLFEGAGATSYNMVKEFAGSTFFDDWTFYNNCLFSISPHIDAHIKSICSYPR
jgi:hypothetical protein